MKPYCSDNAVTLYHGDAREVTVWVDRCTHAFFDPPYGRKWRQGLATRKGQGNQARSDISTEGIVGDTDTAVRDDLMSLWGDTKPAIVFGDLMLPPPAGTKLVGVYRKPADAGLRGALAGVRRDLEAIYFTGSWPSHGNRSSVFATTAPNVGSPNGIVARGGGHPHAKPLDVCETLASLFPGRENLQPVVAVPTAGAGAEVVACRNLGYKVVAVELEERWCEQIARRLAQDVLDFGVGPAVPVTPT